MFQQTVINQAGAIRRELPSERGIWEKRGPDKQALEREKKKDQEPERERRDRICRRESKASLGDGEKFSFFLFSFFILFTYSSVSSISPRFAALPRRASATEKENISIARAKRRKRAEEDEGEGEGCAVETAASTDDAS